MCSIATESTFKFTNPLLKYLEFCLNDDFVVKPDKETVQLQARLDKSIQRDKNLNEATVDLSFEFGKKDATSPFYIRAVETESFKWADDVNEETLNRFLNQNAPTLLLSYLRPVVVQITASSKYGAYSIPFMNFTQS